MGNAHPGPPLLRASRREYLHHPLRAYVKIPLIRKIFEVLFARAVERPPYKQCNRSMKQKYGGAGGEKWSELKFRDLLSQGLSRGLQQRSPGCFTDDRDECRGPMLSLMDVLKNESRAGGSGCPNTSPQTRIM